MMTEKNRPDSNNQMKARLIQRALAKKQARSKRRIPDRR